MQPARSFAECGDQAGVAGMKQREALPPPWIFTLQLRPANGFQEAQAQADPLPFRHDDQAAGAHESAALKLGGNRDMSDGVILEEQVAQVRANHERRALQQLRASTRVLNLEKEWQSFMGFLESVRDLGLTVEQSLLASEKVLGIARETPGDKPVRQRARRELWLEIEGRLAAYRSEVGNNAYAVFNTFTDLAARPPRSPHFRKDRQTLEKRAGAWLKNLATGASSPSFSVESWLEKPALEAGPRTGNGNLAEDPWLQINWEEGLPEPRQFRDDELPLNKDKRYAMSVDPKSLRDSAGRILPLKARDESCVAK